MQLLADKRLGCDIGGTFTDFVVLNETTGEMQLEKVLTTPQEPAIGIFDGIKQLRRNNQELLPETSTLVHGTTLVINALIERKGSPTALITTRGFRDILEMRSELRYDVFDLQIEYPQPLVPRSLRFEIRERLAADGSVIERLDLTDLPPILGKIRASGVTTVAVVLLHSYANPAHERAIGDWLTEHAPELAVSLSIDVLPRIKEYERTSTTVANAYVKPNVLSYIGSIRDGLRSEKFAGNFYVMQSSGGVIESEIARKLPIRIIESGPAAGVAAAQWWAKLSGCGDILSFDMGGTTAKLCAVTSDEAVVTDEYEVARLQHFKKGSGIAVSVPVLDLLEIGIGGGSIARVDRLGLLKVGPQSAGAEPGPVCYGRGGAQPTVTDCDLLLGYLDPRHFLGGQMALHPDAAKKAVKTALDVLGLTDDEIMYGVHDMANEDMAAAARLHLAERGQSALNLSMVAYGGAGPVHAYGLAKKLGIKKILVPPAAGVMSALGMLVANIAIDRARTHKRPLATAQVDNLNSAFLELEAEALALLPESAASRVRLRRFGEFRYVGQGYNVVVPLPGGLEWPCVNRDSLRDKFNVTYRKTYGRLLEDVPIEIINLKVVAELARETEFLPKIFKSAEKPEAAEARRGHRRVFVPDFGFTDVPIYDRYSLRPGHVVLGSCIVQERETTTFVGSDGRIVIDQFGVLVITLGEQR